MDRNFFVNKESLTDNNNNEINLIRKIKQIELSNDNMVDEFVNKNISLESLIEKQLFNANL